MTVWFTVQLDDRPGSLARVATALAERGVNITGIVGVAEDTDGALMLTTSDAGRDPRGVRRARTRVRGARPDGRHRARPDVGQRPPARRGRSRLARLAAPSRCPAGARPRRPPSASMSSTRAEAIDARSSTPRPRPGGRIRTLATVRHIDGDPPLVEIELEVEGVSEEALVGGARRDSRTSARSI